jgi:hypothetical protein
VTALAGHFALSLNFNRSIYIDAARSAKVAAQEAAKEPLLEWGIAGTRAFSGSATCAGCLEAGPDVSFFGASRLPDEIRLPYETEKSVGNTLSELNKRVPKDLQEIV